MSSAGAFASGPGSGAPDSLGLAFWGSASGKERVEKG